MLALETPTTVPLTAAPHVFRRAGPVAVRPGSHVELPVFVSGLRGPVDEIEVSVHVLRQGMSKVSVSLVSPAMEAALLAVHNGGGAPAFGNSSDEPVVFSETAERSIAFAAAPIVGAYRPIGALSAFRGMPERVANGCWRLVVIDAGRGDVGAVVMSVSLAVWTR